MPAALRAASSAKTREGQVAAPPSVPCNVRNVLRVALLTRDPVGFTLLHSTGAETLALAAAVAEALVYVDAEGEVCPALALSWRRVSPVEHDFDLRAGVRFHNGERFDADVVVQSFEAHRAGPPSAAMEHSLSTIRSVRRISPYCVRIETHAPDPHLLRRLVLLHMYPKGVLAKDGLAALDAHPVGTGAYRFVHHTPGVEVVLERNAEHWARRATVDRIVLPIAARETWPSLLSTAELDVALGLDAPSCARAQRLRGVRSASRAAAIAHWFLLGDRGPLADLRVRRALNHALDRRLLVDVLALGLGSPQRGPDGADGEDGPDEDPYPYDPALARRLLAEAGFSGGLALRGVVGDRSGALFACVRAMLERVGVALEASTDEAPDFAVSRSESPLLRDVFLQRHFLGSASKASLLRDPELDAALRASAAAGDGSDAEVNLAATVRSRALMLFTIHEHVHAAFREGANVLLPRSGQFDGAAFWSLSVAGPARKPRTAEAPVEVPEPSSADLAAALKLALDAREAPAPAPSVAPSEAAIAPAKAAEGEWPLLAQVPFGLMVVSPDGRVTGQYSAATPAIFARFALATLEGAELAVLLGRDAEGVRAFRAAYAGLLSEATSTGAAAAGLPSRVHVGCQMYHLSATVLRDDAGTVRGALVTLHDAAGQREAERRAERQEATANILRFRDAFATFARELDGNLDRAVRQGTYAENPRAVRATLHTAKGVFAQFGLLEMVEHIHHIEGHPAIAQEDLRNLRAAFRALVLERRAFWGVDLGNPEARYTVAESALRDLELRAARAADVQSLRAVLRAGLAALRDKTASELLGPIAELATELAERRGKHLRVFVEGGDVPIPTRFVGVLGNLVHLVRNAVDHGLEPASERGDKDPVGTIVLAVARGPSGLRITVSDDGRGIDVERLGRSAVELGLTTAEAFEHMRASAKLDLLFSLGLSTAETITETSGRGVGTAAVRDAVQAAGGHIDVQNHPGSGATFTIVLPIDGPVRASSALGAERPRRMSDRPSVRAPARASARPAALPSSHPSVYP